MKASEKQYTNIDCCNGVIYLVKIPMHLSANLKIKTSYTPMFR